VSREERQACIVNIQNRRNSKVVVLFLGDRQNLETQIAFDCIPLLYDHFGHGLASPTIDFVLYTRGGLTLAGWGIVNLIREFCQHFNVLIPAKALSTGTLIALGADNVLMSRMGQLSPIDPTVNSPYGPKVGMPGPMPQVTLPISVEDVAGFLELARNEAKLGDESSMLRVFEQLSSNVHPLALGAVYRSREQIRQLARKLLESRHTSADRVDAIIQTLTRELGSHDYLIGHKEAATLLGTQIVELLPDETALLMKLYQQYASLLKLYTPYNPEMALGTSTETTTTLERAAIESENLTHVFVSKRLVSRAQVPQPGIPIPVQGILERTLSEGWEENSVI
jgi:sulfur relay (sulfurtransferase) DsrC/TusE family protein